MNEELVRRLRAHAQTVGYGNAIADEAANALEAASLNERRCLDLLREARQFHMVKPVNYYPADIYSRIDAALSDEGVGEP